MSDGMALKIAIDLMRVPSQVRRLRSESLPGDVQMLLRIAAGENEAETTAVALTGQSGDAVWEAATFFIEQILFAPNTDSYRVLGASPEASAVELRRNAALLLRWLHPDLDPCGARSIFVGRVTTAWNDLKTPERRTAYDTMLRFSGGMNGYQGPKFRSTRAGSKRLNGGGYNGRRRSFERRRHGVDAIGFLRRALSVLLHRPLVR